MTTRLTFQETLVQSNKRESELYKCVIYDENHKMLVNEGEEADSAGTIGVNNDFWRVATAGWGSTTLKVGCGQEAADDLTSAFAFAGHNID